MNKRSKIQIITEPNGSLVFNLLEEGGISQTELSIRGEIENLFHSNKTCPIEVFCGGINSLSKELNELEEAVHL